MVYRVKGTMLLERVGYVGDVADGHEILSHDAVGVGIVVSNNTELNALTNLTRGDVVHLMDDGAGNHPTYIVLNNATTWEDVVYDEIESGGTSAGLDQYDVTKAYSANQRALRFGTIVEANSDIASNTPFSWGTSGSTWSPVLEGGTTWRGIYNSSVTDYTTGSVVAETATSRFLRLFASSLYETNDTLSLEGTKWGWYTLEAVPNFFGGYYVVETVTTTSGSPVVEVEDSSTYRTVDSLIGFGIPAGSIVIDIQDSTHVVISNNATESETSDIIVARAGHRGLVPTPGVNDGNKILSSLGAWVASEDTISDFTGASSSSAGHRGLVPGPIIGENDKFLRGDGGWSILPNATSSNLGVVRPDNVTVTITNGVLTAVAAAAHKITVADEAARLALDESNDLTIAIQLDTEETWYLNPNTDPSVPSNWGFGGSTAANVASFNTRTGAVVPVAGDYRAYIAPYSSSASYAQFEVVRYTDGIAYAANDAIPSGTAWAVGTTGATWRALSSAAPPVFTGATSGSAGSTGLVPAPNAGFQGRFLRGDGVWSTIATYNVFTGASSGAAGSTGLVPQPTSGQQNYYLSGDSTWKVLPSVSVFTGATSSVAGTSGTVPAPQAGDHVKFLRGDSTWVDITGSGIGIKLYDSTQEYSAGTYAFRFGILIYANDDIPVNTTFEWGTTGATWSPHAADGFLWRGVYNSGTTYNVGDVSIESSSSPFPWYLSGSVSVTGSAPGSVGSPWKSLVWQYSPPFSGVFVETISPVTLTNGSNILTTPNGGDVRVTDYIYGVGIVDGSVVTDISYDSGSEIWSITISNDAYETRTAGINIARGGDVGIVPAPSPSAYDKYLHATGTWVDVNDSVRQMIGATSSVNGTRGLVPQPIIGNENQFLRGNGTWGDPTLYLTPFVSADAFNDGEQGVVPAPSAGDQLKYLRGDGSWNDPPYPDNFVGSSSSVAGSAGLVPAPAMGDQTKYLRGDGGWSDVPAAVVMVGATSLVAGEAGYVPAPNAGYQTRFLRGDGTWQTVITSLSNFGGATSGTDGTSGQVPAPLTGYQGRFLRGDGTWANTPYPSQMSGASSGAAGSTGLIPAPSAGDQNKFLKGDATWADAPTAVGMTGATSGSDGAAGYVPAPLTGQQGRFLRGDATWQTVITSLSNFVGATSSANGSAGQVPAPVAGQESYVLSGAGNWIDPATVVIEPFGGATSSVNGTSGAVPAPLAGEQTYFLRGNGGWTSPSSAPFGAASSGSDGTAGFVPAPVAGQQTQYLRGDGAWATPTNTTYAVFTGASSGSPGSTGLVPLPTAGQQDYYLSGDSTWKAVPVASDFVGTNGTVVGTHGLVPAPQTTDNGRWLNASGSWTALPVGSSSVTGVVRVDNTTITASGGVISSVLVASSAVEVADETARLALTQSNNLIVAVQLDTQTTWYLPANEDPSVSGNWIEGGSSAESVVSFNGRSGTVVPVVGDYNAYVPDYSSSANYVAGELVRYTDNKVYRANGTITSGTAWAVGTTGATWALVIPNMTGASVGSAGTNGLVPAPSAGNANRYLRSDATWAVPPDTTYSVFTGASSGAAGSTGLVPQPTSGQQDYYLSGDSTWKVVPIAVEMVGATSGDDGSSGIVPAPVAGQQTLFLRGDATWASPSISVFTGASSGSDGSTGAVPAPLTGQQNRFLRGDSTWATLPVMTGATGSVAGTSGAVPIPQIGANVLFLRGDGVWASTSDYTFAGATSGTAGIAGTVPAPAIGYQNRYLRGDGTWSEFLAFNGASSGSAGTAGYVVAPNAGDQNKYLRGDATWQTLVVPTFTGASSGSAGADGSVPAPSAGDQNKVLRGDATWFTIPTMTGASSGADGTVGYVPLATAGQQNYYLRGNGTWTLPSTFGAASSGSGGSVGAVPAPTAGQQTLFLRGDATWATPTVAVFTGASSGAAGSTGTVPAPSAGDQNKYLRGDSTWVTLTNATTSDVWVGTDNTKFVTSKNMADATAFVASTTSGTYTPDVTTGVNFSVTVTGTTVISPPTTGAISGRTYVFKIIQDSTGGRAVSFASTLNFGYAGVPVPSTAANAVDYIVAFYDTTSSTYIATYWKAAA